MKIQRLFWDVDAGALDVKVHQKTVVERVLNDGTLTDWRWLVSAYGRDGVRDVLSNKGAHGRDGIRAESRRLASLILK